MSAFRLIASDLDGTLLRDDGSVSHRTRRTLRDAREAGIEVVLVSARHPRFLRPKAEAAGVDGLAVCSNGAILYDPQRDRIVHHESLDPESARRLIRGMRAALPGVYFAFELGAEFGWEPAFAAQRVPVEESIRLCGDALDLCTRPVAKLIARHETLTSDELLHHARVLGGDALTATYSTPHTIEMSRRGVTKAAGLAAYCGERGIGRHEVVAFGDMPNDVAMLRWAGHGVAVSNAHADVLAAADEVTRSNMDDGVAMVIERILRGVSERQRQLPSSVLSPTAE